MGVGCEEPIAGIRPLSPYMAQSSELAHRACPATALSGEPASFPVEADILAYGINGSSGIVSYSFGNGLRVAASVGNVDASTFLLKGDA
jgi:hypothetical protein